MSQRQNGVNRASHFIRYQLEWDNSVVPTFFYCQVQYFLVVKMIGLLRRPALFLDQNNPEDELLNDHHLAVVRWWRTEALDEDDSN